MVPVRSDDLSVFSKSGCASMAMCMVGTHMVAVQRSAAMTRSVSPGSNAADGTTRVAPNTVQSRLPHTMPAQ